MKVWGSLKKVVCAVAPAMIAMSMAAAPAAATPDATPAVPTVPTLPASPSVPWDQSNNQADQASESQILEWTEMGPWGPYAKDFPAVMVKQGLTENISPAGTNVACTPAPGENPVVLLHGMNSNAYQTFARMAPELKKMGKCLYAFNVGKLPGTLEEDQWSVVGSIPTMRNMTVLDESLAQLNARIDALKTQTGATGVDLVGHSAGATLAAAYAKQHNGEGVGTVVAIAGVLHGTSLLGVSYGLKELNVYNELGDTAASIVISPSLRDLLKHSEFTARLEDGGVTVPGVNYVAISSQLDEAVTPISSSQWDLPDAQNIILQDGCSADLSEHLGITFSPRAIALVANALGRNVDVPCAPVTAFFDGGINDNQGIPQESLDAVERTMTTVDGQLATAANR